ncbi:MAG: hypothetical protein ACK41D_03615 [Rubricoccaceae bacterium]
MAAVLLAFSLLLAAAGLMAADAITGHFWARSGWRFAVRVGVFASAAASGGALLAALPRSEWVLALALVPLAAISYVRFALLVRGRLPGWRHVAVSVSVFVLGALLFALAIPRPLTRAYLQQTLHREAPSAPAGPERPIDPRFGPPVRA